MFGLFRPRCRKIICDWKPYWVTAGRHRNITPLLNKHFFLDLRQTGIENPPLIPEGTGRILSGVRRLTFSRPNFCEKGVNPVVVLKSSVRALALAKIMRSSPAVHETKSPSCHTLLARKPVCGAGSSGLRNEGPEFDGRPSCAQQTIPPVLDRS